MAISIPLEDVQGLLASGELAEAQAKVAEALRLRVIPEEFATPFQRQLGYVGVPVGAILQLLREESDLLTRFAILDLATPIDPEQLDGEFPVGEEPGPNDASSRIEVVGLTNGFLIQYAIYLALARRGRDQLLRFLKWRRIPGANRVCRELIQHFRSASQQS